jgi:hypothetical protein
MHINLRPLMNKHIPYHTIPNVTEDMNSKKKIVIFKINRWQKKYRFHTHLKKVYMLNG